jgi:small-conductance mechanosensitive channel
VGIAIGFGAQKLVSDVLSGLFYLLDDAFRVGEYIEAGSITGAVEKITLRNVMLRHHRGMLQIIPYSDLGAITNFMRGGIVVKINLQFPYDTDVDVVRKVIKRVGIAMLDDPEFGKNFIKQVKSQGIREVGDSILTIRVKFTAKPGTHFVIRREAYRRITEALAAKGIHYAHRKVIVEVPSMTGDVGAEGLPQPLDEETKKRIAAAGAAAHRLQQQGRTEG